jgi:hypothetical protein
MLAVPSGPTLSSPDPTLAHMLVSGPTRVAIFVGEGYVFALVATMVTSMVPLPC